MVRKIDGYLKWWHQNGFCGCGHRFESNRGYNKGRRYGAYFINLFRSVSYGFVIMGKF